MRPESHHGQHLYCMSGRFTMPHDFIMYFDIAAVVVMTISLASLLLRHRTKGAANRVYLTAMVLVTTTAIAAMVGDIYDSALQISVMRGTIVDSEFALTARSGIALVYYALRSLTAPAYMVIIAAVSDTTHRLNNNAFTRFFLWVPMLAVFAVILTNPLHHLIFSYDVEGLHQGLLFGLLYAEAGYYSLIGIYWLFRWRALLSSDEFAALMLLYPIMFAITLIQHNVPGLYLEMFVTSIAMLLVSAFAIHPETRQDAHVEAESLDAYRDMTTRSFITDKPLCLVFLQIVNMERLRSLFDKDQLQNVVHGISVTLADKLERDDVLYYLRDGLFCISPHNIEPQHALDIAKRSREEGKARALAKQDQTYVPKMRVCIVRVPEDAHNVDELRTFVRRFATLVPDPTVTTFNELSQKDDFDLQMALSDVIERGLRERSFEVHYQPIYRLSDGRFHSAEALIRLNDPTFGWVPPALFIPEAEQNGTIIDIGSQLLEKICTLLARIDFKRTKLDYIEVNLSVDQCVRPELAGELLGLLQSNHIDPNRINLEITETSAAYSQQAIEQNVRILHAAGLSFSLDDYGTGYSNVTRALNLPFSLIKFDKSFVDGLPDPSTRTVFKATVNMMKDIGKEVLVEGVETKSQVDEITSMDVDYIQGYYFAKPMPEDEFIAFLLERNAE